jgi:hypothetical protein
MHSQGKSVSRRGKANREPTAMSQRKYYAKLFEKRRGLCYTDGALLFITY